jgi:Tfp pilus assembly protein PilN
MINLLPTDLKQHYIYARRNTRLRHWAFAVFMALIGVGIVTTGGMLYTQKSIDEYSAKVVAAQESLKAQKLEETRKHASEISSSLKLAVTVLQREVLFSKLITQIATVTPANVSLSDLNISNVQGALDITAISKDYDSATQLQVNLEDPANKLFTKAEIQNIQCQANPSNPQYPCTVTIKALFNKDNPFLFINKSNPAAKP